MNEEGGGAGLFANGGLSGVFLSLSCFIHEALIQG